MTDEALAFFPPERPFVVLSCWPIPEAGDLGIELMGHPPFMFRSPAPVEWVSVLDRDRGKGYGATLTWAATLADPTLPGVLIASDPGQPV